MGRLGQYHGIIITILLVIIPIILITTGLIVGQAIIIPEVNIVEIIQILILISSSIAYRISTQAIIILWESPVQNRFLLIIIRLVENILKIQIITGRLKV